MEFWNIIGQARAGNTDPKAPSAQPDNLAKVLRPLPTEDIRQFGTEFNSKLIDLNRFSIWGAGYVVCGGMGDDSFHYFRSWIIGKGKAAYETALSNPDGLADFMSAADIEESMCDNELLEYVSLEILNERGITDDPRDNNDGYADDPPTDAIFDENTVHRNYPAMAKLAGFYED